MSEATIKRILRIALWVLMGVSVIFAAVFVAQIYDTNNRELQMNATEPILIWTYVLLAIAAVAAIIFPLIQVVRNPRNALKLLVSVGALGLVILISYLLASGDPIKVATANSNPDFSNRTVLLTTDTGIIATYIMLGIAILLLAYTGVKSMIGNK
ncbi:MAG: hypothetical protein AL399_05790 [Candidatus [Bacteroides] periocalifornicus]|jgi:hypothetical protein|uniref:Uncharacterized protein n=1 Tax=Candidatus [Bacteroides] periocalifornicus TaxID=1702214 RepID=A0A0Q4B7C7_9BACT|nr:MAG: hypothetical protein AL399_05725 [Candidatus [Bacteroides] periocalifornicus]KQM08727.1 MAG: hypothetical protein AL399_05790 [Candidatus [Bacteroides] periocalifornicus]